MAATAIDRVTSYLVEGYNERQRRVFIKSIDEVSLLFFHIADDEAFVETFSSEWEHILQQVL